MDLEKRKEKYLNQKILFYTEGEACNWKKFPYELTIREFRNGEYQLKNHNAYSEALGVGVSGLCIFVLGVPCFRIAFENGKVFSADYQRDMDLSKWTPTLVSMPVTSNNPKKNESYLDYLKRTLL